MASKKKQNEALAKAGIPQLDLRVSDYLHEVPENLKLEMVVEWKQRDTEIETIGPLKAFAIEDGELKVVNRLVDIVYRFPIKQIKRAYMLPCA